MTMQHDKLAITVAEAAELLSLKDSRTILKYVQEGKLRAVGERKGVRVVRASIDEYLQGASAWHRANVQSSDESPTPARSDTKRTENSRGKQRSPSETDDTDTIHFQPGRKLKRM
jgi:excisionase family DNA binding protein